MLKKKIVRAILATAVGAAAASAAAVAAPVTQSQTTPTAQENPSDGEQTRTPATLSGAVTSSVPVEAAEVRAFNTNKRIMYMVFTHEGRFRAAGLLPGRYEITVEKDGFVRAAKTMEIAFGQDVEVDFTLTAGGPSKFVIRAEYPKWGWHDVDSYGTYDEVFPAGRGRDLIENACKACHTSESYLPANPRSREDWVEVLNNHKKPTPRAGEPMTLIQQLMGGTPRGEPLIKQSELSDSDWATLHDYLSDNFGPGPTRGVHTPADELLLDEAALANAMYVEYYLPLDPKLDATNKRRQAQDPHVDLDGNVWYTDNSYPSRVGRLDPRTGTFTDYMLGKPGAHPHGIAVDAKNNVWWAERDAGYIGKLDQITDSLHVYPSDPAGEIEGPWWAHTPVVDSRQNIWFSNIGENSILKWNAKKNKIDGVWRYPSTWGRSYGMAVDKDDNIWVTQHYACQVAKFSPKSKSFTEYHALDKRCAIRRLGVDRDNTLWYGVFSSGKLGRIDPDTEEITEIRLPYRFSSPYDVQGAPDGTIWISDGAMGGALVSYDPQSHEFQYYPTPQLSDIPKMNISQQGAIWYAARSAATSAVGVLYPDIEKFPQLWE